MARKRLTNEEVRKEIAQLRDSEYVRMARREQRERQQLYNLRWLEKRGRQIEAEEQAQLDADYAEYKQWEKERCGK